MKKTINVNNKELEVEVASSHFDKFRGLMFKKNVSTPLLLENTNGIHTFFMRINIDVILLDKDYNIVKTYKNIKPWRIILPKKSVKHTLEMKKR